MNYKTFLQTTLAAGLLALGLVACNQEKPAREAGAKADAEPAATSAAAHTDASADAHTDASAKKDAMDHEAEPSAADWKTKLQVKMALLENLGTDSLHVEVSAHEGAVGLSGVVEKRETKELAETMAKSIPAVTSVRNDIRLEASADNPNKTGVAAGEAEAELKDAMLSTKVRLALVDGLGSDGFRIGTDVASGVVTLEFAPELAASRRKVATQAAQDVEGVTKVVSVDKT